MVLLCQICSFYLLIQCTSIYFNTNTSICVCFKASRMLDLSICRQINENSLIVMFTLSVNKLCIWWFSASMMCIKIMYCNHVIQSTPSANLHGITIGVHGYKAHVASSCSFSEDTDIFFNTFRIHTEDFHRFSKQTPTKQCSQVPLDHSLWKKNGFN